METEDEKKAIEAEATTNTNGADPKEESFIQVGRIYEAVYAKMRTHGKHGANLRAMASTKGKALVWMMTKNPLLNNNSPIALLMNGQYKSLDDYLKRGGSL